MREDSDFAFAGLRFGLVPTLQCRVTQSTGTLIKCSCWEKGVKSDDLPLYNLHQILCFYTKVTMSFVMEDFGWHKLMKPC